MKNLSTWLLVMFVIMFWIFRIIIALSFEFGESFAGIKPINQTFEIILIFVVLICLILIIKRNILGPLFYLIGYGFYFGDGLIESIKEMLNSNTGLSSLEIYFGTFINILGVLLPILVLIDLLFDKGRKANPKDGKTDWFYNGKQYDRDLDERADKNNYRTL